MSPRTQQQFKDLREEKRALIMRSALELFSEKGYHNGSISLIASRAGISKGLLYNYFESKEDLIKQIIEEGLDMIGLMLDPNRDGIITREEMRLFIEKMFDMMRGNTRFWTLYFSLMMQAPVLNLVKDKLEKVYRTYLKMLTRYFETLGHEDPLTDAYIFGSLMDGIGFNLIANQKDFPFENIKKRLIQLYCS